MCANSANRAPGTLRASFPQVPIADYLVGFPVPCSNNRIKKKAFCVLPLGPPLCGLLRRREPGEFCYEAVPEAPLRSLERAWRRRESGRIGVTRHVRIASLIHGDALARITATAKIRGVDQR